MAECMPKDQGKLLDKSRKHLIRLIYDPFKRSHKSAPLIAIRNVHAICKTLRELRKHRFLKSII